AVSEIQANAMGHAEFTAEAMMKMMLLTLAFAPERLERVETCGWRVKTGYRDDMVQSVVDLPGGPFTPWAEAYGGQEVIVSEGPSITPPIQHAICTYVVLKADASLSAIRQNAMLVCPQNVAHPPERQRNEASMQAARIVCPPETGIDRN